MRPIRTKISYSNLIYRGVPRQFMHLSLDDYTTDKVIKKLFSIYTRDFDLALRDCVNLMCFGSNGTGKTMLTSIIVKEAYIHRYSSYRVTFQEYISLYLQQSRDIVAKEKMADIMESEFLVIDEVGKETTAKNQFNVTVFEELLRKRDTLGNPTIICTNLPLDERGGFYDQYGKSVESLVEGSFVKILFEGEDFRPKILRKKSLIQSMLEEE